MGGVSGTDNKNLSRADLKELKLCSVVIIGGNLFHIFGPITTKEFSYMF